MLENPALLQQCWSMAKTDAADSLLALVSEPASLGAGDDGCAAGGSAAKPDELAAEEDFPEPDCICGDAFWEVAGSSGS